MTLKTGKADKIFHKIAVFNKTNHRDRLVLIVYKYFNIYDIFILANKTFEI